MEKSLFRKNLFALIFISIFFQNIAAYGGPPPSFFSQSFNNHDPSDPSSETEGAFKSLAQALFNFSRSIFLDRSHRLSKEEIKKIKEYSQLDYYSINKALRNGDQQEVMATTQILQKALSKLPRYTDHNGVVYRRTNLPQAIREQHQVGAEVTYPAFTSTSKLKSFPFWGRDRFKIYTVSGRDISHLAVYPTEQEVLIGPNAKFKVESRSEEQGIIKYVLREIPTPEPEFEPEPTFLDDEQSMIWMP